MHGTDRHIDRLTTDRRTGATLNAAPDGGNIIKATDFKKYYLA